MRAASSNSADCEHVARSCLLCCRAAVHLKLKNPEAALKDAECAVELDPQYAKAFLRRASAHQALEHFEEAVKDFEQVTLVSTCALSLNMNFAITGCALDELVFACAVVVIASCVSHTGL